MGKHNKVFHIIHNLKYENIKLYWDTIFYILDWLIVENSMLYSNDKTVEVAFSYSHSSGMSIDTTPIENIWQYFTKSCITLSFDLPMKFQKFTLKIYYYKVDNLTRLITETLE